MGVAFSKSVVWFALQVALFKSCLYFRVLSGKHWMLSTSVIFTTVCTEMWSQRTFWSPRMEWSNYVTLDLPGWSVQVCKIVTIQVQSPNSNSKGLGLWVTLFCCATKTLFWIVTKSSPTLVKFSAGGGDSMLLLDHHEFCRLLAKFVLCKFSWIELSWWVVSVSLFAVWVRSIYQNKQTN